MSMKAIHIVHLYAKEMNIYGDTGNRLILQKRLEHRGIPTKVTLVGVGESIPPDADIIIGGGGQDAGQLVIEKDLHIKAPQLREMADNGVTMLMICGMYQLFCRRFITQDKQEINGIGVFAAETVAGDERLIGNIVTESDFGVIVGYENHSGKTYLDNNASALGVVKSGAGNNGQDKTEGSVFNNVFGTYMHGPVLSKNTRFADELLKRALSTRGSDVQLSPLDDTLEHQAHKIAVSRPR